MLITDTLPLIMTPLPSGNEAAIIYAVSLSDVVICLLLLTLVLLQVVQMWRTKRTA